MLKARSLTKGSLVSEPVRLSRTWQFHRYRHAAPRQKQSSEGEESANARITVLSIRAKAEEPIGEAVGRTIMGRCEAELPQLAGISIPKIAKTEVVFGGIDAVIGLGHFVLHHRQMILLGVGLGA